MATNLSISYWLGALLVQRVTFEFCGLSWCCPSTVDLCADIYFVKYVELATYANRKVKRQGFFFFLVGIF